MNENQKKFMNDFHELCKKYSIDDVAIETDMDGNPIITFNSNGEKFGFKEYATPSNCNEKSAFYNIQHKVACYYVE